MAIAKVVGVTFRNEGYDIDRQEVISKMSGKEKIYLKREPNNRFDPNAVAVVVKRKSKDVKIGYLKAELAALVSEMWSEYKFIARVKEIKMGDIEEGIPWGMRIEIGKYRRDKLRNFKKKREKKRE